MLIRLNNILIFNYYSITRGRRKPQGTWDILQKKEGVALIYS